MALNGRMHPQVPDSCGFLLALSLLAMLFSAAAHAAAKSIALTFDDLPYVVESRLEMPRDYRHRVGLLVEQLQRAGAPAVGFINEQRLYRAGRVDPVLVSILENWLDAGLELGNHTYSHLSVNSVSMERFTQDVLRGEEVTRRLVSERGRVLRYFRYPYLQVGNDEQSRDELQAFLRQQNYRIAPVTINTSDWIFARAYDKTVLRGDDVLRARVAEAYLAHTDAMLDYSEQLSFDLFGSGIPHVLGLHANRLNADLAGELLTLLRERGYSVVTLDEVLSHRAYQSVDSYFGSDGESWLHHWARSAGLRPADEPAVELFVRQLAGPQAAHY